MKIFTAILIIFAAAACNQKSERVKETSPEDNVLIDYIETPKNKARGAREAVEAVDAERQRQLDAFDE
ncbi:MAG: hypothetical protein KDD66_05735 [Bdellovibrionales bacterium]|nr:hypothetical protein [Bdellovibrionales bacterium]